MTSFLKAAANKAATAAAAAAGLAKDAAVTMAGEIKEKGVGGAVSAAASAANEAVKAKAAEVLATDWMQAAVKAVERDDAESLRAALLPDDSLLSSGE
jgi:hypothetical protein